MKVNFPWHFLSYTLIASSFFWKCIISMLVEPISCKNSWIWTPLGPPVKFWTCFPTWASNRNLNFQEKLQNGLCSCTSWSNVWHTIEMFDTYPESSWYKLLENTRKSWNNHKSYFTILDKNTQKRILCLARQAHAKIQNLTAICCIVKLIPWHIVNLSHL